MEGKRKEGGGCRDWRSGLLRTPDLVIEQVGHMRGFLRRGGRDGISELQPNNSQPTIIQFC